ncbi:heat shock protein Hsp20 domain-containing protein [Dictyostelium discoideum AX4]|uniref:Small heat shock protein hspG6 n=1 Tax=Dictyostelium discoideum TaxID=44689 RepID=HSPG6_DICDI|nr:heat shock protein Hsp20 domain-containing protein [Dictyostelium discoideum AX4]Q8MMN1.2 RecName: Full=Small heat shock protein hspG6 [Dictyostelium discoideum]EAL68976.1 heat shock protein Hsp20 domain-containing protein [Dictyostelium discoideum AX4]|eukprot:XP_642980.1 heat shock protein Hsp20 domain-containing protein [Dictyostelium discoideum AX4]
MATIFDILNTLNNNNNNNNFENCKRQCPINKSNKTIIDKLPPMDVTMTNDKLIIETELAGISKDHIEIDIKDSILTIQGEKKKNLNKQQQQLVIEKSTSSSTLDSKEDEPSIEEFEDDIKPKSKSDNTTVSTTTTATTKENKEDENKTKSTDKKFISERSFGNFKRYLDLTKILYQLDLNSINTQFENGLLTITINKKLHYSNTIKININ